MRQAVVVLAAVLIGAAPAPAQDGARLEVRVDSVTNAPAVQVHNLLDEPRWRDALADAFPVRLKWRIELWRDRTIIDQNVTHYEFDIVIRRDALLGYYFYTIIQPRRAPTDFAPYTDAASFAGKVAQPIILNGFQPRTPGTYYYAVTLRVSALDDDEFVEMRRFMGGGGGGSFLDAIRGSIMRLVGVPTQTLPQRSERFEVR